MSLEALLAAAQYVDETTSKSAVKKHFSHLIPFLDKQRERTVPELYISLRSQGRLPELSKISFRISDTTVVQRDALAIFAPPNMYQFSPDTNTVRIQVYDEDSKQTSIIWLHDGPEPSMILCSKQYKLREWTTTEGLVLFDLTRLTELRRLETVVGPRVTKEPFMPNYRNDSVSISGTCSTCSEATTPSVYWEDELVDVDVDIHSDSSSD